MSPCRVVADVAHRTPRSRSPPGVEVTLGDDHVVTVKGPQGELARPVPAADHASARRATTLRRRAARRRAPEPGPARPDPVPGRQHGRRRDRGLHQGARDRRRRLPGHRPGPAASSSWPSGSRHPVHVDAPDGVTFEVPPPTRIIVRGIDKEKVGQVAADIRKLRKPEPYKGKGVRYAGERVVRKAGKAAK